jgi:hypothetical protein
VLRKNESENYSKIITDIDKIIRSTRQQQLKQEMQEIYIEGINPERSLDATTILLISNLRAARGKL